MINRVVYVQKYRSTAGQTSGILAIAFAILGIFTFGWLFVPLAALLTFISFCSSIGLFRGFTDISGTGFMCSLVAGFLTFVAILMSPSLWLMFGLGALIAGASHKDAAATFSTPVHSTVQPIPTPVSTNALAVPPSDASFASMTPRPVQNICAGKGTSSSTAPIPYVLNKYLHDKVIAFADDIVFYRCIDNETFVCANENGWSCDRPDTNKEPNKYLAQYCRDIHTYSEDPPAVITGHNTPYIWVCRGGKPVIASEEQLDSQGYRKENWIPVTDLK